MIHHSKRRQQTGSKKIVQLNEEASKGWIKELIHVSVEEPLSQLLENESRRS